jgi:hypothetical protein
MTRSEAVLYHQIHPAKLATDIVGAVVSLVLLWQHELAIGLAVMIVPSVVATGLVMRFADLERLKESPFGRYVGRWMTPAMQAVRVAGLVISSVAAWRHAPVWIAVGLAVTLAGWLRGALVPARDTGPSG